MISNSRLYFCGDDLIQRGVYAQNIKNIIKNCHTFPKNNDNNSYVIGISAPWGSGKTHFVQMLKSYIEGDWENPNLDEGMKSIAKSGTGAEELLEDRDKYPVIYYNAWENDFWDNAFEPLFDRLIDSAPVAVTSKAKDENLFWIGKKAAKIIALGIKGYLSKKIEDAFDIDTIDDINKEIGDFLQTTGSGDIQTHEMFPEYELFKNAIEVLRQYLNAKVKGNKKLIIIIDELDRCKPTFAVQTLEVVKHLFNIEGIVFIFSLDINQLSSSVKAIYGNDFEAIGYLERFFNYMTILPHGKLSSRDQSYMFISKMGLKETSPGLHKDLLDAFIQITDIYNLSLREVKTVLAAYSVLEKTVLSQYLENPDALILYFYFLCMKYKYPIIFSDGVFKNGSKKVASFIDSNTIPFIKCEDENYLNIIHLLQHNKKIKESELYILKNGRFLGQSDSIKGINNNSIVTIEDATFPIEDGLSLSALLYYPDIMRFDAIKDFTPLEFIFRQLEMCDFIRKETPEEM